MDANHDLSIGGYTFYDDLNECHLLYPFCGGKEKRLGLALRWHGIDFTPGVIQALFYQACIGMFLSYSLGLVYYTTEEFYTRPIS